MKLSISLSQEDVVLLDRYVSASGVGSRSAAIQHSIRMLGDTELEGEYAAAWEEWAHTGEATDWDATASDGLTRATR